MPDDTDTFAALTRRVLRHREERDWGQFHTPKELGMSLCVEAAELLSLMQWKTGAELDHSLAANREQVSDEMADVLHSLLLLASDLGVSLPDALEQKLTKDARKYPVDKAKGKSAKYTEL